MPAQVKLPPLPTDANIQKGTLGSGLSYYMVTDRSEKGYADIAIVQRDEPLSEAKREGLRAGFFRRMAVAPGPEGYLTDQDGSTVYRFTHIPFYRPEALDSTLLNTFALVAASKAQQAVIVCGDIDAPELKKKMDIFSMLVPRMLVKSSHIPDYVWETSPAPSVQFYPGGRSTWVSVTYECARIPFDYMNTAQSLVTDLFGLEFEVILRHRLRRTLSEARIPCGEIRFDSRRSADYGGNERYTVSVQVDPSQLDAAMRVISCTLGELDTFGVTDIEFSESKQALLPYVRKKADTPLSTSEYTDRCIANFLYWANLAPYSETLRLFARKNVADSTEARLFNRFSSAMLEQLSNLTLEYTAAPDSLDKDEALFYYNLEYLYGSLAPSGRDYSWHAADTLGLQFTAPKLRIRSEKPEAVSGGVLWTFSNGLRVIFKQVPGNGIFHYALQLNGGLAQIDGLREGEGGYIGDMLSLYDSGGLRAEAFRDILTTAGISMDTRVQVNSMSIGGVAPSSQLDMLLKVLHSLAENRQMNTREFEAFKQSCDLRGMDLESRLQLKLSPGYVYTTARNPEALQADTQQKAEKYFADRFARMNDGVLIIAGDLNPEQVKKTLLKYMGGFRTLKGSVPRKMVSYQSRSGVVTFTEDGPAPLVQVLMEAPYPVSADHMYAARVGVEALRKALVQHLAAYGFSSEVSLSQIVHPQERFQVMITCRPLPLPSLPASVAEVSSQRALSAVRAAISQTLIEPEDLQQWKAKVAYETERSMSQPSGFVSTLLARYASNKDVITRYRESIGLVSEEKVREFLTAMAQGSRVEYIVP